MNPIIEINNLGKQYKRQEKWAVRDVDLTVKEGELIGILGPNGAGKSTLVKMILGVIRPTCGTIRLLGKEPLRLGRREKSQIGVFLGGKSNLIFHLPLIESLKLFQAIYKVPDEKFAENLSFYSKVLHCEDILGQRVATLSLGQKLRAELLCILIYEPRILILDEPTIGLDIEGKKQLREILRTLAEKKNISILITTHDVNDMEKLCTKILMICQGRKLMEYTSSEFLRLLQSVAVVVTDRLLPGQDRKLIEHDREGYRYLFTGKELEENRESLLAECRFVEDRPRLEDILYEYYR